MTRPELALQVYGLERRVRPEKNYIQVWIDIAKTDDITLRERYEELLCKNYSLAETEEDDETDSRHD